MCVCRSDNSSWESVVNLSFYHVGSKKQTQAVCYASKYLCNDFFVLLLVICGCMCLRVSMCMRVQVSEEEPLQLELRIDGNPPM